MAKFKHGDPKPKNSGRKKNVPNVVTREIRQVAHELLDDLYFQELRRRLLNGDVAPQLECVLHYYAWGKPKHYVEISGAGDGKIPLHVMRTLVELGDEIKAEERRKTRTRKKRTTRGKKTTFENRQEGASD